MVNIFMRHIVFSLAGLVVAGVMTTVHATPVPPTMEFLFDGGTLGGNITAPVNTGTIGGSGTGQTFGSGSLTYTQGVTSGNIAAQFTDANPPGGIGAQGGQIDYSSASLGTVDWTFMMLVRRDGDQMGFDRIFETSGAAAGNAGFVALTGTTSIEITLGNRKHILELPDGEWTHIAVTYDHDGGITNRAFGKAFLNGVYVPTPLDNSTFRADYTNLDGFIFGSQPVSGNRPFNGGMDTIQFFPQAFTDAEVFAAYQAAIPEPGSLMLLGFGSALLLTRRRAS